MIFYPGQKLIEEGQTDKVLYIIIEGMCNFVCNNTKEKMKDLEILDDPTKERKEAEFQKRLNPYRKYSKREMHKISQNKNSRVIGEQFGTIQSNGYISKTLKQV